MAAHPAPSGRLVWGALLAAAVLLAHPAAGPAQECRPTDPNPAGPFYLTGAPFTAELAPADEPGQRMELTGWVLAMPDCRPVSGAVLDVWHASDGGVYYNLEGGSDPASFRLRGKARTDGEGRYRFATILPGHYPVGFRVYRPRHIHVTVTAPGLAPLTTQVYFRGDPHLARDGLVRAGLITDLESPAGEGKPSSASFDFVLSPSR